MGKKKERIWRPVPSDKSAPRDMALVSLEGLPYLAGQIWDKGGEGHEKGEFKNPRKLNRFARCAGRRNIRPAELLLSTKVSYRNGSGLKTCLSFGVVGVKRHPASRWKLITERGNAPRSVLDEAAFSSAFQDEGRDHILRKGEPGRAIQRLRQRSDRPNTMKKLAAEGILVPKPVNGSCGGVPSEGWTNSAWGRDGLKELLIDKGDDRGKKKTAGRRRSRLPFGQRQLEHAAALYS